MVQNSNNTKTPQPAESSILERLNPFAGAGAVMDKLEQEASAEIQSIEDHFLPVKVDVNGEVNGAHGAAKVSIGRGNHKSVLSTAGHAKDVGGELHISVDSGDEPPKAAPSSGVLHSHPHTRAAKGTPIGKPAGTVCVTPAPSAILIVP